SFSVNIAADETVDDLKKKIKEENLYQFPADELELYRVDGLAQIGKIRFDFKGTVIDDMPAKLLDYFDGSTTEMVETFPLCSYPQLNDSSIGRIHVLVVPESPSVFWVVNGSVENAVDVKGVRSRLYRLAHLYLGYYDPNHADAFVYDDKKLMVHVLFTSEENAQIFDAKFLDEYQTIGSPLSNLTISSNVDQVTRPPNVSILRRVKFGDYNPSDSDSLHETISLISTPSDVSYSDQNTEVFQYQRIEHVRAFGCTGKAEKAHLISKEHCENYQSYKKYKEDPNNILALSRAMHGWFDALDTDFPLFKVDVESWEEQPSVDGRYKVILKVTAASHECKDDVFGRLKEGSERTNDPLTMNTFVYVEDPKSFRFCLQWKSKEIQRNWDSYFSMNSAVS
ncbi:hypothetical protein As57867_024566, partial [Aphanomyces stellatus]